MPRLIPPRLHLLRARRAPVAVIIRRGPSRWFHLVRWNQETDELEHGSWFHGRIYELKSDLSFDGQWMVYFALGATEEYYSWTAVCRPPWFHAFALWPARDTWRGGGVFDRPNRLWLDIPQSVDPALFDSHSIDFQYHRRPAEPRESVYGRRLERDHWTMESEPIRTRRVRQGRESSYIYEPEWRSRKRCGDRLLVLRILGVEPGRPGRFLNLRYEVQAEDGAALLDLPQAEWADWDLNGRLVVAREGIIERYTREDLERGEPSFRIDARPWQREAESSGPEG